MRASNAFDVSQYEIKTIGKGLEHLLMRVTFQCRGLSHLELYCILTIEALVRTLRDKNRSRANCVPIYGDLYQILNGFLPLI